MTNCFICGQPAVARGSALNPGGPVCYIHSWGKTKADAKAAFYTAVLEIVRATR